MTRILVALTAVAALTAPALADPNCLGNGGSMSLHVGGAITFGGKFTEQDQSEFDKMRLRQHGIDADTAERTWLGCLKVTRRGPGGWITEYYDPDTFELKPLY